MVDLCANIEPSLSSHGRAGDDLRKEEQYVVGEKEVNLSKKVEVKPIFRRG